jgi:hypothetical protein
MQRMIMQKNVMGPLMDGFGGWLGGIGKGKGAAAPAAGATSASFFGAMGSTIDFRTLFGGFFASGGPVLAGTTYLVGERGPELFTAPATGSIIPNNRLYGPGEGAPINVTIIQHINSNGNSDTQVSGQGAPVWSEMAKGIENLVKQTIQKEQRLGNSLNPVFGR